MFGQVIGYAVAFAWAVSFGYGMWFLYREVKINQKMKGWEDDDV